MATLTDVLTIENGDNPHTYRAPATGGELSRTFGGELLAQGLYCALHGSDPTYRPFSLQAAFIRPGDSHRTLKVSVDKLSDARTFQHHRIDLRQDELVASAHLITHGPRDSGPEHAEPMPSAPHPDACRLVIEDYPPYAQVLLRRWSAWDLRPAEVPGHQLGVWMKHRDRLPDDPAVHAAGVAYLSDMTLLHTAMLRHPRARVQLASQDHSLRFLCESRVDEWLLYVQNSPAAWGGRALSHGTFYDAAGNMVAAATQAGMMRDLREGGEPVPLKSKIKPQ